MKGMLKNFCYVQDHSYKVWNRSFFTCLEISHPILHSTTIRQNKISFPFRKTISAKYLFRTYLTSDPIRTSFFSPKSKSTSTFTKILQHCDRAIVLSRNSSNPRSLWSAKEDLECANRLYIEIIRSYSLKSDIKSLSYETYLIRSGYAHVIRTIGALIGQDGAIICANLLKDYLHWEIKLYQLGFWSSDGSERWKKERRKEVLRKDENSVEVGENQEEALLYSGPFLQDMAPIIHDILFDLTSYPLYQKIKVQQYHRSFPSIEHKTLASEIRILIRQLPFESWKQPFSSEWNRFRNPTPHPFQDHVAVIDACIIMEARAQIHNAQHSTAFEIWVNEVKYWQSHKKHTHRLLRLLSDSFRTSIRVFNRLLNEGKGLEDEEVRIQINSISSLFNSFCSSLCTNSESSLILSHSITDSVEINTIFRCLFATIDFLEDQRVINLIEEENLEQIVKSARMFGVWLEERICSKEEIDLPLNLKISTYNLILDRLMRTSKVFGNTSIETSLILIERMLKFDKIPSPDTVSMTILIKNAAKTRNNQIISSAILAAYNHLNDGQKGSKNLIKKSKRFSTLFEFLLKDSLKRNDEARMVALLDAARFLQPKYSNKDKGNLQNGKGEKFFDTSNISARSAIFILYPSLLISGTRSKWWKRMGNLKNISIFAYKRALRNSRTPHSPNLAKTYGRRMEFQPSVLTSALHLAAQKGLTGLAERLWRLWLRVVRSEQFRKRKPEAVERDFLQYSKKSMKVHQSISALTILIRLYGNEILFARQRQERSNRLTKLMGLSTFRRQNMLGPRLYGRARIDQLRYKSVVRGWGRILTGPSANVQQFTEEGWMNDRAMTARKMAQMRYWELRNLWMSKDGIYDLTKEKDSKSLKPLQIPIYQKIDPSIRPDERFYRVLLAVFRQNGKSQLPFDENVLQIEKDLIDFLRLVSNDMKAFLIKSPFDLDLLIAKYDQKRNQQTKLETFSSLYT